jgi:3-oxoacyl-[acyl-carrier protein] reductase
MDLQLTGKVALVTGASRGIGRAIAGALAAEGCRLALCARGEEGLQVAAGQLRATGADVWTQAVDVRDAEQVRAFVDGAAAHYGGIDILVNNVGGSAGGTLLESSDDDWRETFELNLFHAVRATRCVLPHMAAGATVVTVSSISGWKPAPKAQYGSAKAAEMFLAGALAWELADRGIRVNTVCPGSILFPGGGWERFRERDPEGFEAFASDEFPAGRLGSVDEVADVVCFLCSPRAQWVNGASIPVDGAQGRPNVF